MSYYPVQSHRIPTLLGLGLLLVMVGAIAISVANLQTITRFFPAAQESGAPSSAVQVGNITDTAFVVHWNTATFESGAVFYGDSPSLGTGVAVDERDLTAPNGKYLTHFVRLSGLKPQTKYYFKVAGGKSTFGDLGKNNAPYEQSTGPKLGEAPIVAPLSGKVTDQSGAAAQGAVAVWSIDQTIQIATLVKSDGTYVLPIATARRLDLGSYADLTTGTSEKIIFDDASMGVASLSCVIGRDNSLPTVKLKDSIDCQKVSGSTQSQKSATQGGSSATFNPPAKSSGAVQVNISSGQTVPTPLPTISGTAGPNQKVQITIHSDASYTGTVVAGPDGSWSWTPPSNLTPGQHTVTITVVNPDGTSQSVTRTFFVAANSPILPITSGTPAATLTHKQCVSNACVQVSGAGSDSCVTSSDCAPATPPPATPAPPPPPPPSRPPKTGETENTLLLLSFGGVLTIAGLGLFLKGVK